MGLDLKTLVTNRSQDIFSISEKVKNLDLIKKLKNLYTKFGKNKSFHEIKKQ